ncbi:MAG: hypothetical protein CME60_03780 [Halobacteriovoraceae bacterium]|nr:hypothetical protein [Halobacteriovoraceae bacterium]
MKRLPLPIQMALSAMRLFKLCPTLLALLLLTGCSLLNQMNQSHSPNTLRVLHYNIFELDSEKIEDLKLKDRPSLQLKSVKELLAPFDFHLLSVNEIQYDQPGVPYPSFQSDGENLAKLTHWLRPNKGWDFHFVPANTGAEAKKIAPQSYATSEDEGARFYADPNNYGLFPGQYSTGLSSRYPIKKKISIKSLPWKSFHPEINLNRFRNGQKEKLPKDLALFDKAFMDTVIEVNHKEVHVITLHTVPAYHFGNKKSPNYQRNLDQLRFLEWYLTGKTDIKTQQQYEGISPLKEGSYFIAMGDWNTDINQKNPGSAVLKRLAKSERLFPAHSKTWEAKGFLPGRMNMRLDYIYYSDNIKLMKAQVIIPDEKRVLLGCEKESLPVQEDEKREVVSYTNKAGKECFVSLNQEFKVAKDASDHFPIWAEFKLR